MTSSKLLLPPNPTNSDISFVSRQQELRKIYSEFRAALDDMQTKDFTETSPLVETSYFYDENSYVAPSTPGSSIQSYAHDLHEIIDEIRVLKSEVLSIKSTLRSRGLLSRSDMGGIIQKIDEIILILDSQRERALALSKF